MTENLIVLSDYFEPFDYEIAKLSEQYLIVRRDGKLVSKNDIHRFKTAYNAHQTYCIAVNDVYDGCIRLYNNLGQLLDFDDSPRDLFLIRTLVNIEFNPDLIGAKSIIIKTRDGARVDDIHYFSSLDEKYKFPIFACIKGEVGSPVRFTANGRINTSSENSMHDLFMYRIVEKN